MKFVGGIEQVGLCILSQAILVVAFLDKTGMRRYYTLFASP